VANQFDPKNYKILIVDDEVELVEIIKDDLEFEGFQCVGACSGEEAIGILRKDDSVDLVLSDVRMPHGDGIQLLERIKAKNVNRPEVILLTGFSEIPLEKAYDLGAIAVFEKPVNFEALLSLVRDSLIPKEERYQRKHERFEANLRVIVHMSSFQEARESRTVNIGRGGIFIQLDERLPELEETVDFSMDFHEAKDLRIKGSGIVKWVRPVSDERGPAGIGLEFSKLLGDSHFYLLNILNSIKTRSYIPSK